MKMKFDIKTKWNQISRDEIEYKINWKKDKIIIIIIIIIIMIKIKKTWQNTFYFLVEQHESQDSSHETGITL
jgi:flagellar basal body-associated protein FliL